MLNKKRHIFRNELFFAFAAVFLLIAPFGASVAHADTTYCFNEFQQQGMSQEVCRSTPDDCITAAGGDASACYEKTVNSDLAQEAEQREDDADLATKIGGVIFTSIGQLLLYVPTIILDAAADIFNAAVEYTVVDFSENYAGIQNGIEGAWKSFRDIGNIVLIVAFAYAAFRIVLGLDSFGLRSFIARTIIIALLVNFSLLFTKLVIDVGNIVAVQVAGSMQAGTTDIGMAFKNASGISSIHDVGNQLRWIYYEDPSNGNISGMFGYVLGGGLFAMMLALVFLYAAFLLIIRYLALILIVLTSALAFIAYAIPNELSRQFDTWMKSLMRYTLFAPLFMLFLWAVLLIVNQFGDNGSLAHIITNPNKTAAEAFIQFVVIIGLLFASTKIASSLSIAGASWANAKFGKMAGVVSGAGLVARAGRASVGRAGKWASESKMMKEWAGKKGVGGMAQRNIARMALDASNKAAKRTYDLRDSKLAKALEKASGVNLGKGIDSYEKQMKDSAKVMTEATKAYADRRADKAFTEGEQELKVNQESAKQAFEEAQKNITSYQSSNADLGTASESLKQIDTSLKAANKQVDTLQQEREAAQNQIDFGAQGAEKERLSSIISESDAKIRKLHTEISEHEKNKAQIKTQHGAQLDAYRDTMKQLNTDVRDAEGRVKETKAQKTTLEKEKKEAVKELQSEFLDKQAKSVVADTASHVPYAGRALKVALNDTRDVNMARKALKKDPNEDKIEKMLAKKVKELGDKDTK